MKQCRTLTLFFCTLLLTNCQSNETERIHIPPFLDIPRLETSASKYVEDIRSDNQKYRVILFDELFPIQDTSLEEQNRILENYIIALEQTGWEFFGTVESQYGGHDRVWRFVSAENNCSITIRPRLVNYYKEIGDVYFGIESHDRIHFKLTEDLSVPCKHRIPSKSFDTIPED